MEKILFLLEFRDSSIRKNHLSLQGLESEPWEKAETIDRHGEELNGISPGVVNT